MKKLVAVIFCVFIATSSVLSSDPSIWTVNSKTEILKGDARGVSIAVNGTLTAAPRLTEVFKTDQAFIWSSALDTAGNMYLGTGSDGKVFKVDPAGKGSLLTDLNEMNVSAIAVGRAGEVFAGTSPDGKVYRIDPSGQAEVYFSPGSKYIWSLAVMQDGTLAVGTGDGGRIYKVRMANASPEASLLFDTSETNIISLAADRHGYLYAGTDPGGIVMRFGPDGKPFALLDSSLKEAHEIAIGPDGSVYALLLGESASAPKPEAAATPAAPESKTVSVDRPNPATPDPPAKSRYDLTGAKSAVYRVLPDGSTDIIWVSTSVTGFSMYPHQTGNGVLVGTSDKGRIYSISNNGDESLALQTDANQISTIRTDGRSLLATSSNQGVVYRFGPETVAEGVYESSVLDAKGTATWGRIWWRSAGTVSVQTRSGNTEKPDETWSGWSAALSDPKGGAVASPKARYIQWRASLRGSTSTVSEVSLAFIARNIAPEVLSIVILPTNVGLAANPPVQLDPNIELAAMSPADFGIPVAVVPPRKVYQRGATSLQWNAEDRNGDKLLYDVQYREVGDTEFRPLRAGITENFVAIDGQSLADGRYIFRVIVSDSPSNPESQALSDQRDSEPVDIDNTPPIVAIGPARAGRAVFTATEAASYLIRAEYSVNGGEWKTVYPEDGISDSQAETYVIEVPGGAGEYTVTLRVFDVNRNSGNARQVIRR